MLDASARCYLSRRVGRDQRGDTIVEVLIATAIISLVLVMAYATAAKNSRAAQETREYTQAAKIAERQVELLRVAARNKDTIPPDGGNTCYPKVTTEPTAGTGCTFEGIDGSGATYQVDITRAADTGAHIVTVQWDTLGGSNADITMRYIP
ncbi:type II secretion system protein [Candidatus Saccharibacteria bacterium]|nr:type II secretion system protein [Candidatus Saccharibacteria bacterium]